MTISPEWLGFAGIGLSAAAYLPQIIHVIRQHSSKGLSPGAYSIWVVSTLLLFAYSVTNSDLVFILLQSYQLAATMVILYYSLKYRSQCEGKASGKEDGHNQNSHTR